MNSFDFKKSNKYLQNISFILVEETFKEDQQEQEKKYGKYLLKMIKPQRSSGIKHRGLSLSAMDSVVDNGSSWSKSRSRRRVD